MTEVASDRGITSECCVNACAICIFSKLYRLRSAVGRSDLRVNVVPPAVLIMAMLVCSVGKCVM